MTSDIPWRVPKQAEIDYVSKLTPAEFAYVIEKPFSDATCGQHLMDLGLMLSLLPPPPRTLLDLGVGSGWTSLLFAQRGYEVVGLDLAPAMIELAREKQARLGLAQLRFVVGDYESVDTQSTFDIAIFYDALHHAEDEDLALSAVCRVLKPGGLCLTAEPGADHDAAEATRGAVDRFGVTEKSMPPSRIIAAGRRAGFRSFDVYERPTTRILARDPDAWRRQALRRALGAIVKDPWRILRARGQALAGSHIIVLRK